MRKIKPKECIVCGKVYQPTGSCSKYCEDCKREAYLTREREYRRKTGRVTGIGKGGSNKKGKEHSQYTKGVGYFQKIGKEIKKTRRYCERCGKDLKDATHYQWVIHHKDHNHDNNVYENFELLCKRCHQIEHECINALAS